MATNLADFFAYVVFVLVLIIFFFLFSFGSKPNADKIAGQALMSDTGLELLNIFRTPMDGQNNIADLCQTSIESGNFVSFEQKVKPLIDQFVSSNFDDCCWELKIDWSGKIVYETKGEGCLDYKMNEITSSISIPPISSKKSRTDVYLTLYKSGLVGGELGVLRQESSNCAYKK